VAAVTFGPLARARGASPVYDRAAGTCSAVACHGAGLLGPQGRTVAWTRVAGNEVTCTGCHLDPPRAPHSSYPLCSACHGVGYTSTAATAATHLDGVVDVKPSSIALPASIAFGDATIGEPATRSLYLRNRGVAPVNVSVYPCAGTSAEFTASFSGLLERDDSRYVAVRYAPADLGADAGCLVVASDDVATPRRVALSGNGLPGPILAVDTATITLGEVDVRKGAAVAVPMANAGATDLVVTGIAPCYGGAEFSADEAAGFTLAPGESRTVTLRYTPLDLGFDQGCLAISSNDRARPTVQLIVEATAIHVPAPVLAVSPPSLDFGAVRRESWWTLPLTVSNAGDAALTVSEVARCAGTSDEFRVQGGGFTLAPAESRTVWTAYRAENWGADAGCLAIASNDPDRPRVVVPVSGSARTGR
jgi:predicted CxxxxCH...CXXCH cytochrome family protein